jgi:hypothetical protein
VLAAALASGAVEAAAAPQAAAAQPAAPATPADVILLRNGDRISGRILGETSRSIRMETAYGRLVIPRGSIERIQRRNQKQEVVNPPQPDAAPALPRRDPTRVALVFVVLGRTFWQAWDPKDAPADPTLRFEVSLDEEAVATFTDAALDEGEIPRAVVNAFSFAPGDVAIHTAPEVEAKPPEVRPGRVVLRLEMPVERAGSRHVRVAYPANRGTAEAPEWKDVAEASLTLDLAATGPAFVQLHQDPGHMEFAGFPRRRMRRVETFRLDPIVE